MHNNWYWRFDPYHTLPVHATNLSKEQQKPQQDVSCLSILDTKWGGVGMESSRRFVG